ncbi:hypothetical protein GCM10023321_73390 [Pseudonocardia eucalypti]|uniref:Transposase n=1 Tax=Pseudonocardia eucalypti TaxID=648755 RepID=A0ABP9R7Y7_9PSEU
MRLSPVPPWTQAFGGICDSDWNSEPATSRVNRVHRLGQTMVMRASGIMVKGSRAAVCSRVA